MVNIDQVSSVIPCGLEELDREMFRATEWIDSLVSFFLLEIPPQRLRNGIMKGWYNLRVHIVYSHALGYLLCASSTARGKRVPLIYTLWFAYKFIWEIKMYYGNCIITYEAIRSTVSSEKKKEKSHLGLNLHFNTLEINEGTWRNCEITHVKHTWNIATLFTL